MNTPLAYEWVRYAPHHAHTQKAHFAPTMPRIDHSGIVRGLTQPRTVWKPRRSTRIGERAGDAAPDRTSFPGGFLKPSTRYVRMARTSAYAPLQGCARVLRVVLPWKQASWAGVGARAPTRTTGRCARCPHGRDRRDRQGRRRSGATR